MAAKETFNEEKLISELKEGNIKAFDEIYWKYQRAVYLNVFKLTKSDSIAEDIVQEVFISLWEKRQTIDTDRSVAGWLFVSSYNRSVNALKKKLKESLVAIETDQLTEETESQFQVKDLQLNILEKAIQQLPPQKRKVFELCKLEKKTYEEAAKEMNISKHTVKEYLSGAIHSIKEFISQHPEAGTGILALLICW